MIPDNVLYAGCVLLDLEYGDLFLLKEGRYIENIDDTADLAWDVVNLSKNQHCWIYGFVLEDPGQFMVLS